MRVANWLTNRKIFFRTRRIVRPGVFFQEGQARMQEQDVTSLLLAMRDGDSTAARELVPLVYDELRRLAGHYMRGEKPGHTLQATALVHEAWLKLIDTTRVEFENRSHFFAMAAQQMRRILVDHARARQAGKRGGKGEKLPLNEVVVGPEAEQADIIALDDALQALAKVDPQQSRIVELRYFGGLSIEETAAALGISPATVKRDWNMAKAWLYQELRKE
jgi:RNA polymerase sigma factor (TIGR02999 family)